MEEFLADRIDKEFKTAWEELLRLSQSPNKDIVANWNPGISVGKIIVINYFMSKYSLQAAEKTTDEQMIKYLNSVSKASNNITFETIQLIKTLSGLAKYCKEVMG